jgi:hypothetical protein
MSRPKKSATATQLKTPPLVDFNTWRKRFESLVAVGTPEWKAFRRWVQPGEFQKRFHGPWEEHPWHGDYKAYRLHEIYARTQATFVWDGRARKSAEYTRKALKNLERVSNINDLDSR